MMRRPPFSAGASSDAMQGASIVKYEGLVIAETSVPGEYSRAGLCCLSGPGGDVSLRLRSEIEHLDEVDLALIYIKSIRL